MGHFTFVYSINGGNHVPVAYPLPVAATQTLVEGDLLVLSSGQVAKAAASVVAPIAVVAEASDGAAAGTLIRCYLLQPHQVWRAVADADATAQVLGAKTIDINSDQTVDIGDTSGGSIAILSLAGSTTLVDCVFTKTYFTEIGS